MKLHRIFAVFMRYAYNIFSFDHATELFFWPFLDFFIWGITVFWIQTMNKDFSFILPILTALVFWQVLWRSNYEVSVNVLKDLWARNFVNLFSTPLKMSEWIISLMLLGFFKNVITISFGAIAIYVLYSVNILYVGLQLIPYVLALIVAGWWSGFISASIIVYFGQRMQMIAWIAGYIFYPFCAVIYPVTALPGWAKKISAILPMTYIFEGLRSSFSTHCFDKLGYIKAMCLNALYLVASIGLFLYSFEKSRNKGLARLE